MFFRYFCAYRLRAGIVMRKLLVTPTQRHIGICLFDMKFMVAASIKADVEQIYSYQSHKMAEVLLAHPVHAAVHTDMHLMINLGDSLFDLV